MKMRAFTLAELLITLSIIGVIAILVVPNVTQNTTEKTNIAKLQTTIESLNSAVEQMKIKERTSYIPDTSLFQTPTNFFDTYMKLSTDCAGTTNKCFNSTYQTVGGTNTYNPTSHIRPKGSAILTSGAAVGFEPNAMYNSNSSFIGIFYIDVNGTAGPNIIGRDFFAIYVQPDSMLGAGTYSSSTESNCKAGIGLGSACITLLEANDWEITY